MSQIDEQNLKKLERLLAVIDNDPSLTKQEFENAFQKVIDLVLQIQKQQGEAINKLEETYAVFLQRANNEHNTSLNDLKGQVNDLFVSKQLQRMNDENKTSFDKLQSVINSLIDKKIQTIDAHMSKVKDGYTPIKNKDYFDGLPGLPGKIDETELKKIKSEIEAIKKLPRGKMGMRKVPIVRAIDLTADVDGSTTTFILPRDTVRVLGVWSTQFPITFRLDVDFTLSGQTLTLVANQVGTPQAGQTLGCLIETLFYA